MKTMFELLILSFAMLAFSVHAGEGITCSTPRENKVFTIQNDKVAFQEMSGKRSLASQEEVQTVKKGNGMTTSLWMNGQKHIIHINDLKNFSESEDYIILRSRQGHEVIYPLSCK